MFRNDDTYADNDSKIVTRISKYHGRSLLERKVVIEATKFGILCRVRCTGLKIPVGHQVGSEISQGCISALVTHHFSNCFGGLDSKLKFLISRLLWKGLKTLSRLWFQSEASQTCIGC